MAFFFILFVCSKRFFVVVFFRTFFLLPFSPSSLAFLRMFYIFSTILVMTTKNVKQKTEKEKKAREATRDKLWERRKKQRENSDSGLQRNE